MRSVNREKAMMILFATYLFVTAVLGYYKTMRSYIFDEPINNQWSDTTGRKFESDYAANFLFGEQYVDFNGLICRLLGQYEMNGVVKLNNGYLNTPRYYSGFQSQEECDQFAGKTKAFQNYLEENGITFAYFTVPYVLDHYNDKTPIGVQDYGNSNLDRLTAAMMQCGVDTVDLRILLHEDGLETYDIFFRTDHHWTNSGGFWAYTKIAEYLEKKNGFDIDDTVQNPDSYTVTVYPNSYLGSRGQRTGKLFAGADDFPLVLPDFDTYVERFGTSDGGTFQEMMVRKEPLQNITRPQGYLYDNVFADVCGMWHNPRASVDKTVIIVGDSFSKAVCPYLALSFSNVIFHDAFDLSKLTTDRLKEYQPDMIIALYYIDTTMYPGAYNWCCSKIPN